MASDGLHRGLVGLDLRSACPSLAMPFLYGGLKRRGLDSKWVRAIRTLHSGGSSTKPCISHFARRPAKRPRGDDAFLIVADALVRLLPTRIPAPLQLVSCADDIAVASLDPIAEAFGTIEHVMCLQLNLNTSTIAPIFLPGQDALRAWCRACSRKAQFSLADFLVYLGAAIGLGASDRERWKRVSEKIVRVANESRGRAPGLVRSVVLFGMQMASLRT